MELLRACNALRQGHFVLSSGLHSDRYFQCALAFADPQVAAQLVALMVPRLQELKPTVAVGPALGGIVAAYEVARQLGIRTVFTERVDGHMAMRRGFTITPGDRCLVVEDVVTTGGSALEVVSVLKGFGALAVGLASVVDRSGGTVSTPDLPVVSVVETVVPTFAPLECPLCREGVAVEKPGSRNP